MTKRSVLFLGYFIFLFCSRTLAQKQANHWFFGNKAGINFNGTAPVFEAGSLANREGCSSISDSSGNLLFYTNGYKVWNRNHQLMPNSIVGPAAALSSTQSSVIVAQPGNDSLYYVFSTTQIELTNLKGIYYSIVNMHRNSGLGDVVQPPVHIYLNEVHEKITAIKNSNGRDVWILAHEAGTNNFLEYNLTSTGLDLHPAVMPAGGTTNTTFDRMGYLKVSPDGSKIAMACTGSRLEIFNFNTRSGAITEPVYIGANPNWGACRGYYGVEFSCNSKVLYATCFYLCNSGNAQTYLMQYNLDHTNAIDIINSELILDSALKSSLNFSALQMAPNGRIIISMEPKGFVGCISNPNVYGAGCGYIKQYIVFPPGSWSRLGLPNFVQSTFITSPKISAANNCASLQVQFNLSGINLYDSIRWHFGDSSSGNSNTSTEPSCSHIFSAGGYYMVKAYVHSRCKTDSLQKLVSVGSTNHLLGDDLHLCPGSRFNLKVHIPQATYLWQDGSAADSLTVHGPGLYWVSIHLNGCTSTDSIYVYDNAPSFSLGADTSICENTSLHFNLSAAGESFLWQDGSTSALYNIGTAGKYFVTVTAGGCSKTDTLNVALKKIPVPNLGPDKTICKDDVIILFPGKLDGSYLWQDSSVNLTYRVTKGGFYRVLVSNKCGSASDDIEVKFKDCKIYWPTAFTPNNDGKNDVFRVLSNASFNKFKLQVFNRWGELLFTSNNSSLGWDGNYKDVPQLPGSYVWSVEYVDRAGMKLEDKGFVLLIR